jgi:hypothetical protein
MVVGDVQVSKMYFRRIMMPLLLVTNQLRKSISLFEQQMFAINSFGMSAGIVPVTKDEA